VIEQNQNRWAPGIGLTFAEQTCNDKEEQIRMLPILNDLMVYTLSLGVSPLDLPQSLVAIL
jgi:hypothetical protein